MIPAHPFDDDKLHEECGVFGVFGHPDAAKLTVLGLHALQHRGQEGAGIVSFDGENFHLRKELGQVGDRFTKASVIERLKGARAIGHTRYSTAGHAANERNIQPFYAELSASGLAVAHNGNLTNNKTLRQDLIEHGSIFHSTSDTENIVHLIARSRAKSTADKVADALREVEGAYSLIALTNKKLIGVRDPVGVRPLVLGNLDGAYVLASETCALDIIGADFVRDIEPGEMVVITEQGLESRFPFTPSRKRFCIFEYVYFARPDSIVEGASVYEARKQIGRELAREAPADVDMVIPVPDSGVPAALGFADASQIPFELGIIRNHYVGRTFIEPADQIRHLGVKLKHNANKAMLEGRKVVLVDDSIVRGTTSTKIVQMVREAGASEVHMRIASPPTTHPCFYGVDTPRKEKLLASRLSVAGMAEHIGADSLAFVTIDGLYRAMGVQQRDAEAPQYCDACFTGEYPTKLTDKSGGLDGRQLSLLIDRAAE